MPVRSALCGTIPPLAGYRVGVTADRRAEEQGELLRRLGAEVLHGSVMRTLPLVDDRPMRAATEAVLADAPSTVLLTTGIGLRAWVSAAESWGLADDLLAVLAAARLHARGPKAYATAVQLGLDVARREPTERLEAMVAHLTRRRLDGEHLAVQLYGTEVPWAVDALRSAGARVTAVPVYRWAPPDDEAPARRLVRDALDGRLAAVTFTCPSAVDRTCRIADDLGVLRRLLAAFDDRVAVACVGPFTRAAAAAHGIARADAPTVGRLGLMVRALAGTLRGRHLHLAVGDREVVLQGGLLVAADGARVTLADRERQVLAALARRPGVVVSRAAVEREVWGNAEEDRALDAVLTRLRRRVAPVGLVVTTKVRRGYQLVAEPLECGQEDEAPAAAAG